MRTIIAGTRTITDQETVNAAVDAATKYGFIEITSVVCGMARGVDLLGKAWARSHNIPVAEYPADWSKGKSAGATRNQLMAENADALIAVWDFESRGTQDMIARAQRRGLKIFVQGIKGEVVWSGPVAENRLFWARP